MLAGAGMTPYIAHRECCRFWDAFVDGNWPTDEEMQAECDRLVDLLEKGQLTGRKTRVVGNMTAGERVSRGRQAQRAVRIVKKLDDDVDEAFLPLLHAGIKNGTGISVSNRAVTDWVMANLLVDLSSIDPRTVPNRQAVSLLQWARSSDDARQKFMAKATDRMIPAHDATDHVEAGLRDDARTNEQLEREWGSLLGQ